MRVSEESRDADSPRSCTGYFPLESPWSLGAQRVPWTQGSVQDSGGSSHIGNKCYNLVLQLSVASLPYCCRFSMQSLCLLNSSWGSIMSPLFSLFQVLLLRWSHLKREVCRFPLLSVFILAKERFTYHPSNHPRFDQAGFQTSPPQSKSLLESGEVVTWGDAASGGNSEKVADRLASGVTSICSTMSAFAAVKSEGCVSAKCWTWRHGCLLGGCFPNLKIGFGCRCCRRWTLRHMSHWCWPIMLTTLGWKVLEPARKIAMPMPFSISKE